MTDIEGPYIVAIACVVIAATMFGLHQYSGWAGQRKLKVFKPQTNGLKQFRGDKFVNQEVLLDGHSFVGCVFENVTFKWNGTTGFELSHNEIFGCVIASDHEFFGPMIKILDELNYFRPEISENIDFDHIAHFESVKAMLRRHGYLRRSKSPQKKPIAIKQDHVESIKVSGNTIIHNE